MPEDTDPMYAVPADERLDYDPPDQTPEMIAADDEHLTAARAAGGGIQPIPAYAHKPALS